jgi:hypothetical protein
MQFRTDVLLAGKTATGIVVPPEVVESLGAGKRPPVSITINGYTYRSTIAVMDGRYMVGISAENRAGAKVAGGDIIDVEIELDTQPREVTVPEDLSDALAGDLDAHRFFETLSYSNKRAIVTPIADAKSPETRERRIARAVERLHEGRI